MGLDLVELIIKVEETFGFSIPDEDVAALDTVGRLYECVLTHRFGERQEGCLTSVVFYRLRRALMSVFGLARNDVRPTLDLAAVIPNDRRRRWSDLQESVGLRLPELVRPRWVTAMVTVLGCILIIATAAYLVATMGQGAVMLGFFIMWIVVYLLYQGTKPLAVVFRPEFATVGGLTKFVLYKNFRAISDEGQRASAEDVWSTLRTLVAEQLGVRADEVTKDSSFVRDLGAD